MTLGIEARASPLPEYNHTGTPNLDEPEPKRDIDSKFLLAVQGFYWLGPSDAQKAYPKHVTLTSLVGEENG